MESSYFADSVRRFEQLLADMEKALTEGLWLAGESFSLADIGYAPYIVRLEHLKLHAMWDRRPRLADWFLRIKLKHGYQKGLVEWFNSNSISLMEEKGAEAWPRIRAILSG